VPWQCANGNIVSCTFSGASRDVEGVQGDEVSIPKGWNLVIDVPTPKLKALWIDGGNVTIPDSGGLVYTGYLIIRNNGSLTAGTPKQPVTGNVYIVLHGTRQSEVKAWTEEIVMGSKVLAVLDGRLSLHALQRTRHVPLAEDAPAGATSLVLASVPVGWQVLESH
jgi:hypothetical protein